MALKDIKDLLFIAIFGFTYYAIVIGLSGNLFEIPQLKYFILPTLIPFFLGFLIIHSEQVLEWPLAFLFGGALASILLVGLISYLGASMSMPQFALVLRNTIFWFGLMSAQWIFALAVGYFLKLLVKSIVAAFIR